MYDYEYVEVNEEGWVGCAYPPILLGEVEGLTGVCLQPFLVHKVYQMDYSRSSGEYRMLERFLPQVRIPTIFLVGHR